MFPIIQFCDYWDYLPWGYWDDIMIMMVYYTNWGYPPCSIYLVGG